jgi:peptidoglycan/xylan/chitin deacetylase (PgdA/CDA1 family)
VLDRIFLLFPGINDRALCISRCKQNRTLLSELLFVKRLYSAGQDKRLGLQEKAQVGIREIQEVLNNTGSHTGSHQPYRKSSTIQEIINHTGDHQPYRRSSTIQEVINHTGDHQPYRRSSTIQEVINHTGDHQPYRRSSTIQEIINHTGGHQPYRRSSIIQEIINHTGSHQPYRKSSTHRSSII